MSCSAGFPSLHSSPSLPNAGLEYGSFLFFEWWQLLLLTIYARWSWQLIGWSTICFGFCNKSFLTLNYLSCTYFIHPCQCSFDVYENIAKPTICGTLDCFWTWNVCSRGYILTTSRRIAKMMMIFLRMNNDYRCFYRDSWIEGLHLQNPGIVLQNSGSDCARVCCARAAELFFRASAF